MAAAAAPPDSKDAKRSSSSSSSSSSSAKPKVDELDKTHEDSYEVRDIPDSLKHLCFEYGQRSTLVAS